ncbi:nuclear transport factor 2 family protein [Rhodobacter sp. SY28-1]|uniref:nuclear transport factor 2 family protein n=1 Tax=Rhodobacter sp. SY28-1 TaxID=2562317 RepID=UPI0010C108F5|nr:nuclear transport factor 2 family protein [Rhodobacter sp. SY28-1]
MAISGDFQDVAAVLAVYFDGLHFADSKRLAQVFHPQAQYVCVTDGTLLFRDMATYFLVVDARISPASKGEVRRDEIVSIEFAGPVTARAMLHCTIGDRFFTDFLTLIKLDGRWLIISKVFHYVEEG